MGKVLIIGAGGVGQVVAHKVSQAPEVFSGAVLASRTRSKCDAIAAQIAKRRTFPLETAQVDADDPRLGQAPRHGA
jgi:saccharopine dehydrogenase (NAD+, L-lysine-forming)